MKLIKNKKVAFIINSLEGGGAEKVLCNWLREMEGVFRDSHAQVYLILLDKLPEENECPDYVNKITLNSSGKLVKSYQQLKPVINDLVPDIIFSFLNRSNVVSTLIGKKANIPTLISERANTSQHFNNSLKGRISKLLVRLIYPKATKVLAVSGGVMKDLINNYGVSAARCDCVYNAYDTDKLEIKAAEIEQENIFSQPYIVAIGRLQPVKNFALMIDAYAQSKVSLPLLILGEGGQRNNLEQQIQRLGLSGKVILMGYQSNPYPYLKHAEYLVSTSNAEGFPNGIAESLCLGTPILATNCESGPAEILADDIDFMTETAQVVDYGILCQPKSLEAVVKGFDLMQQLTRDEIYKTKLVSRAKLYSFDTIRTKLISEINQYTAKK